MIFDYFSRHIRTDGEDIDRHGASRASVSRDFSIATMVGQPVSHAASLSRQATGAPATERASK